MSYMWWNNWWKGVSDFFYNQLLDKTEKNFRMPYKEPDNNNIFCAGQSIAEVSSIKNCNASPLLYTRLSATKFSL